MDILAFSLVLRGELYIEKFNKYPWTGNIRELRNVIERLMILGDNPVSEDNIIQFAPK